jgi:carbamoyltransferase
MFIPPDPGDGGTSVGTALLYAATNSDCKPEGMRYSAYLGASFEDTSFVEMLQHFDPDHSLPYLKRGHEQKEGIKWHHKTYGDEAELLSDVAQRIADRNIVGWYQKRAELGPRALGNRSILIRPDDLDLATRLSTKVKSRALFRPYAFSVTNDDALKALDVPEEHLAFQRWMQYAVPVRPEMREQTRAAIHCDGTTRPQVCYSDDNPRYHRLLKAVGGRTGLELVVNTSFNPAGYPIVSTPVEALVMFARTDMDALVINDTIVWKE